MESISRTLLKSITFRVLATIATSVMVFFFTENVGLAAAVGGIDAVSKLALYYVHERAWNHCAWGTK